MFGFDLRQAQRRMLQAVTYFGEMCLAPFLAIFLFTNSSRTIGVAAALTATGVIAWTLAEYVGHRFVLHRLMPTQYRIHHAYPGKPVVSISWQIWGCFAVVYLIADGAFLAGSLVAYAWYLFVHHCTHHDADRPGTSSGNTSSTVGSTSSDSTSSKRAMGTGAVGSAGTGSSDSAARPAGMPDC